MAGVTHENEPVPNDAIDLMSKFLLFTPSDRIDAFDALAHPYFDELRLESKKFSFVFVCVFFGVKNK